MINAQIIASIETMEIGLEMGLSSIRMETVETLNIFFRSLSAQWRDSSQNIHTITSDQHNNSAFRRSDNRPATDFASYEQKFPHNNQTSSNVVRFTTTDDTINELSDLCPLNY